MSRNIPAGIGQPRPPTRILLPGLRARWIIAVERAKTLIGRGGDPDTYDWKGESQ